MTTKKNRTPVRPDKSQDSRLIQNRGRLLRAGLKPDALPWHWVGGVLIDNATGKALAHQFDYDPKNPPTPYWDRWRHKKAD